jgi:hypothetical protein
MATITLQPGGTWYADSGCSSRITCMAYSSACAGSRCSLGPLLSRTGDQQKSRQVLQFEDTNMLTNRHLNRLGSPADALAVRVMLYLCDCDGIAQAKLCRGPFSDVMVTSATPSETFNTVVQEVHRQCGDNALPTCCSWVRGTFFVQTSGAHHV